MPDRSIFSANTYNRSEISVFGNSQSRIVNEIYAQEAPSEAKTNKVALDIKNSAMLSVLNEEDVLNSSHRSMQITRELDTVFNNIIDDFFNNVQTSLSQEEINIMARKERWKEKLYDCLIARLQKMGVIERQKCYDQLMQMLKKAYLHEEDEDSSNAVLNTTLVKILQTRRGAGQYFTWFSPTANGILKKINNYLYHRFDKWQEFLIKIEMDELAKLGILTNIDTDQSNSKSSEEKSTNDLSNQLREALANKNDDDASHLFEQNPDIVEQHYFHIGYFLFERILNPILTSKASTSEAPTTEKENLILPLKNIKYLAQNWKDSLYNELMIMIENKPTNEKKAIFAKALDEKTLFGKIIRTRRGIGGFLSSCFLTRCFFSSEADGIVNKIKNEKEKLEKELEKRTQLSSSTPSVTLNN